MQNIPYCTPITQHDYDNAAVGIYTGVTDKRGKEISVAQAAAEINAPRIRERSDELRREYLANGKSDAYDELKRRMPAVTFGGVMRPTRAKKNLATASGLLVVDLDDLSDEQMARLATRAPRHPAVAMAFPSFSNGYKIVVSVTPKPVDAAEHEQAWRVAAAMLEAHGYAVDQSGKDVSRLCFLAGGENIALQNPTHGVDWRNDAYKDIANPPRNKRREASGKAKTGAGGPDRGKTLTDAQKAALDANLNAIAGGLGKCDGQDCLAVCIALKSLGSEHRERWLNFAYWHERDAAGERFDNADGNDDEPLRIIAGIAARYGNRAKAQGGEDLRWITTGDDDHKTADNNAAHNVICAIHELGWADRFRRNEWTDKIEYRGKPVLQAQIAEIVIAIERMRRYKFVPTNRAVNLGVEALAAANPYNPVREKIRAAAWDGWPRLETAAMAYFGCDAGDSISAYAIASIVEAAVARALDDNPEGVVYPYMPILHSDKQGRGKGNALEIIAPGPAVGNGLPMTGFDLDRKQAEVIIGASIVELPEFNTDGAGLRNANKLITTDVLRNISLKYARDTKDIPVRCAFVWTTNQRQVLPQGDQRRYPFVSVGEIDLDALAADAPQLWAEAAHRYDSGKYRERGNKQAVRLPEHIWDDVIEQSADIAAENPLLEALNSILSGKTAAPAFEIHSELRTEGVNFTGAEFADAMKTLGYKASRAGKKRIRTWKRG